MSVESNAAARPVVEIRNLSRRFGSAEALTDVSLSIPRGVVFGLVGTNGAGKTTLIKHAMGLMRAQAGSVSVFGLDPVSNPTAVLSRVGYLSELNELPEWMRVDELINFTRAFYPNWDESYAQSLRQNFELEPQKVVQTLSKGQRARLGLLLALSYRPELLDSRRALLRPRSAREARHPARHHQDHRGGRPHRAVFLAPARRSRARGGSRRHHPRRPHHPER